MSLSRTDGPKDCDQSQFGFTKTASWNMVGNVVQFSVNGDPAFRYQTQSIELWEDAQDMPRLVLTSTVWCDKYEVCIDC